MWWKLIKAQQGFRFKAPGAREDGGKDPGISDDRRETNVLEHVLRLWQARKVKCWSGSFRSQEGYGAWNSRTLLCGWSREKFLEFLEQFQMLRLWESSRVLRVVPEHERFKDVGRQFQAKSEALNNIVGSSRTAREVPVWPFIMEPLTEASSVTEAAGRMMSQHFLEQHRGRLQNTEERSRTWCCGRSCQTWWCSCRSCQSAWSSNLSPCQSSGWQGGWRTRRKRSWAPPLRRKGTRRHTWGWSGWSNIYLHRGSKKRQEHTRIMTWLCNNHWIVRGMRVRIVHFISWRLSLMV